MGGLVQVTDSSKIRRLCKPCNVIMQSKTLKRVNELSVFDKGVEKYAGPK